jgi:hypothetical protein
MVDVVVVWFGCRLYGEPSIAVSSSSVDDGVFKRWNESTMSTESEVSEFIAGGEFSSKSLEDK